MVSSKRNGGYLNQSWLQFKVKTPKILHREQTIEAIKKTVADVQSKKLSLGQVIKLYAYPLNQHFELNVKQVL